MGKVGRIVYPDTCILIYWLERNPTYVDAILQKLHQCKSAHFLAREIQKSGIF